jgi:hypothetical protein
MKRTLKSTKGESMATVKRVAITNSTTPNRFPKDSTSMVNNKKTSTKVTSLTEYLGATSSSTTPGGDRHQQPAGQWVLHSYLPNVDDDETRTKIFNVAKKYFADNRNAPVLIYGQGYIAPSAKVFWPVCQLNNIHTQDAESVKRTPATPKYEEKYLAAYFANPINSSHDDIVKFYLYKKNTPNHFIELSKSMMGTVIAQGEQYLEYLRSIEQRTIAVGDELPEDCPPLHILQEDNGRRIIMQIDKPDARRQGKTQKLSPTISIRQMRFAEGRGGKPSYWFHDKVGVTLSATNFFFMLECALKNYMYRIEAIMRKFGQEYDDEETTMSVYSAEIIDNWNTIDISNDDDDDNEDTSMLALREPFE